MVRIFGAVALVLSVLATSVLARPSVDAPRALVTGLDLNKVVSGSIPAPAVASPAVASAKIRRSILNLGSVRSHTSDVLRSISGRISSNWRSNQGEVVVVQNVVKSLILSGLQGGSFGSSNVIDLNDIQLVLSQLDSFGFNNTDVAFIEDVLEQQIFENDIEEILLDMFEQLLELFDVAGFEGLFNVEHFESNNIEIVHF